MPPMWWGKGRADSGFARPALRPVSSGQPPYFMSPFPIRSTLVGCPHYRGYTHQHRHQTNTAKAIFAAALKLSRGKEQRGVQGREEGKRKGVILMFLDAAGECLVVFYFSRMHACLTQKRVMNKERKIHSNVCLSLLDASEWEAYLTRGCSLRRWVFRGRSQKSQVFFFTFHVGS